MQRGSARGGSGQFEPQAAARSSGCVARGLGQINASLVSTDAREAWAEPEGAGNHWGQDAQWQRARAPRPYCT